MINNNTCTQEAKNQLTTIKVFHQKIQQHQLKDHIIQNADMRDVINQALTYNKNTNTQTPLTNIYDYNMANYYAKHQPNNITHLADITQKIQQETQENNTRINQIEIQNKNYQQQIQTIINTAKKEGIGSINLKRIIQQEHTKQSTNTPLIDLTTYTTYTRLINQTDIKQKQTPQKTLLEKTSTTKRPPPKIDMETENQNTTETITGEEE